MDDKTLDELRKPFHPSHITWKPGVISKNGDKALALAYADLRAYMNRLDEVCGTDWSVDYAPWGDRLICRLSIGGITRASTGEPDKDSDRAEISGTVSEAQSFKRACAMFGLGRYLYTLPSVWAEYDKERRQFTEPAKAKLLGLITQHYRWQANGEEKEPVAPAYAAVQASLTGHCVTLVGWGRKMHHAGDAEPCTPPQYQYLSGLIDNHTGKDNHRWVMSVICQAEITNENYPAYKVAKGLVDALVFERGKAPDKVRNPDYNPNVVECVKAIANLDAPVAE